MNKKQILEYFDLFSLDTGGIGSWLTEDTNEEVFNRLSEIDTKSLKKVQLNQLLVFGLEAPVSDGFFDYYWNKAPKNHPYSVKEVPDFCSSNLSKDSIISLSHLRWGLYRLYIDALLYFGNVRSGYRILRGKDFESLECFFSEKRINTDLVKTRGEALPLEKIATDKRYLISEMACKSYDEDIGSDLHLKAILIDAYRELPKGSITTFKGLVDGKYTKSRYEQRVIEFKFSTVEVEDEIINSEQDIEEKIDKITSDFRKARKSALTNTDRYLSMISDLDVYVATSMRNREDFRDMAKKTDMIFKDQKLADLSLRYFDPTLSAAKGHEDKGLIECLMVKCAKVLVYCAGTKESYGKDAEAAMALSLGKLVIFLCDGKERSRFYKDVHPLTKLIDFNTGIAIGAVVTDNVDDVSELLCRFFENRMEYTLEHPKPGYLRLKEKITGSIVRLQTSDPLLSTTFWNHYHGDNKNRD